MTTTPDPATSPGPTPSAPSPTTAPGRAAFRERLWPGPLGWGGVVAFAGVLGIAFVPVDTLLALVVGVLALFGGLAAAVLITPLVSVERGTLRAGAAQIPVRLLAEPRVLDRAALRTEMGPALDARAYACLRSWIGTAVRVEVRDPQDPTPYWIVSTRRPDALVAALGGTGSTSPRTRTAGHPEG
ncbi:DUF3093 domain-containing protein [Cellulomonas wangsupingiae]|uniref:DUF3093 domain-containing protein n=1 Tax=Cellulomonas wangsupingiae TaxID=2968085 RepID=A0ABY5K8J4_9CELL|nr:DUF3093 domain-containing protein [Cellulomonas wangsupingiae]MCC2333066.1 DUF3093 domain-containing protein [Cellulomonas wangsupingiae]MCM0640424.1 DUF3093 domain-containing protein [Cellulomonas wangsupingiae]UUI66782.1 DUF3093 domain-containing protein [Cellulomonas wangsupingiae]